MTLWLTFLAPRLAVFPGLMESIDSEDYDNAVRWAVIIENCILDAAKSL